MLDLVNVKLKILRPIIQSRSIPTLKEVGWEQLEVKGEKKIKGASNTLGG
jgi:hypothetical protein